jgi:dihydroxyacid dehydratase/phosphogluconate dehydratase
VIAALPAVDSRRSVLAQLARRRIVDLVREAVALSKVLDRDAFENAVSGPSALIRDGDLLSLDLAQRSLRFNLSRVELASCRKARKTPQCVGMPAYQSLHVKHTLRADQGCDLDFLVGLRHVGIARESH